MTRDTHAKGGHWRIGILCGALGLLLLAQGLHAQNALAIDSMEVYPDEHTVTVGVYLSVDTDLSLVNLHIGYDDQWLQIDDTQVFSEPLRLHEEKFRAQVLSIDSGVIKWTLGETKGTPTVLAGEGALLYLTFDIHPDCPEVSLPLTWERADAFDSGLNKQSFPVKQNGAITVKEATSLTVSFVAAANGSIQGTSTQVLDYGEDAIPVTAVADPAWKFSRWTLDGVEYSTDNPIFVNNVTEDLTFVAEFVPRPHSADQDGDWRIDLLPELTRLVQFINSGGYHLDPTTEDGYAPGPGDTSGTPHSADQNGNWLIDLSPELTRLIQFMNSGGYHLDSTTEDGYAPGLLP